MLFMTAARRARLRSLPLPPGWRSALEKRVHLYRRLTQDDRDELAGHIQVLLAEKSFEGAGGLEMTDEVQITIAGYAGILLLHRETDYFPGLSSVVVYPDEYLAPYETVDEAGVVTRGIDRRSGESWERGTLVLSWSDVRLAGTGEEGCYNVVLHEFAHQLDLADGITGGIPLLGGKGGGRHWRSTLAAEYERLVEAARLGTVPVLDPYGAESPAEFFAVATEAFFEDGKRLAAEWPHLYGELARYYRQDPARWPEEKE